MPNDEKRPKEQTQEEIDAEKFRTFFSTGEVPEEVEQRRKEEQQSLLGKLFHCEKAEQDTPAKRPAEMPTGEISLNSSSDAEEPQADLQMALPANKKMLEFEEKSSAQTESQKQKAVPAEPAAAQPSEEETPQQNAPSVVEQQESAEMRKLKSMLFGKPKKSAETASKVEQPALKPQKTEETAPSAVVAGEKAEPEAPVDPKPVEKTVQAAEQPTLEKKPKVKIPKIKLPIFHFFGKGDDEAKAKTNATASNAEDSTSLPLAKEDDAEATSKVQPAPEASPKTASARESAPKEAPAEPKEPLTPKQVGEKLRHMGANLTLRCVLSGILAMVLLNFDLVAEGLTAPYGVLDPVVVPAAFYAANLLFLAASIAVGYPVLRDGLKGIKGRPSADTMPALAACAALLQAVIALLNAQSYQTSSFTLLSGIAALGLFMALLGSRVMLAAVKGGYELVTANPEHTGAYRVKNKDLIRMLSRSLEEKDPWILFSRSTEWNETFMEQCFGVRASEIRSKKVSRVLLGVAIFSGLVFLSFGGGINGGAAALTAVLCMGAPLSSTLIAGMASLRLQRNAAVIGAVVPGWAAVEELGGIDTIQVDADDLFTSESATLEDIRIFKGGRIDRAILYAASILNQSCNTLRGLFQQIIEDRTEILYPVKDLEFHRGLGFSGWCDNNRILIGTREYMESEDVPVPEKEYEENHSKNGALQILYLAVSGNLHAMFVIRYTGGRNVARSLEMLQREGICLLVSCEDPSLTAKHITEAYHLPDGMVTILDQEQYTELAAAKEEKKTSEEENGPETCCMLYSNGFISLTGTLRAAEQAQNAETAATTVQLVSVWFSVAIALLLTYAGSVGMLSVAAVLMYQAAWSGLSLIVCALKQHN